MFQVKVAEKIKTHFVTSDFFLNRALYQLTMKNMAEPDRPQIM
jgi:hypothetical protein